MRPSLFRLCTRPYSLTRCMSSCWTPLHQHTGSAKRSQYSIGTSAVKRSRLRREYWHLAQDAATFGDVWNALAGRSKVKGQKVKLFRYQLANLSTLPANADMRKVEASHLCGNRACFAPGHIAWEAHHSNTSRDWCHADDDFACGHMPACIRGPISRTVLVPGERRRGGRRRADAAWSVAPSSVPTPSPAILAAASSTFPTPPVTPPFTLSNQLPSLAGPSRPAAVRRSSHSSSWAHRSSSASPSSSHSLRTSRASSELSVVPDSEDEGEGAAAQEAEVELAKVELERPPEERASSVAVLDLTASDDEYVAFGDIEVEEDDELVLVSFKDTQRDPTPDTWNRPKRLFDLVSTELATLARPQKRQRHALPITARLTVSVRRILGKRLFRVHRPLTSWYQAIKGCWRWIE